MKVAIGCDHGGINLKPVLVDYLNKKGIEYKDFGTFTKDSCDYNDYAALVANAVVSGEFDRGILICGTGIGMSIAANKVKGIRCAHCHDVFSAKMTRLHNDANVIAMGERVIGAGLMLEIVDAFLNTDFSNDERHVRRVNKIKALEEKNFK
ncbi:MAG: ribose 5-phosphate isomerase B [Clostridia bacterium]|nr:ribose 5-phosphate isomerase B [Clostridia bacterium]